MQTSPSVIKKLFDKYTRGEASVKEVEHLFKLIGNKDNDAEVIALLKSELEDTDFEEQFDPAWESPFEKIKQQAFEKPPIPVHRSIIRLWPSIVAACAAVVILAIGAFFFSINKIKDNNYSDLKAKDIAPGKVSATLTLANGKKISLDEAANGEIAKEIGVSISKTADGRVLYNVNPNQNTLNQLNTLSTAIGETYELILPDQTKVWLNAASSLTYHIGEIANGERRVKLTGEAYFEVAKDKEHPFIVESGTQEIKVIGTHFNVNAYRDENACRTTLLEGSVKITDNGQTRMLTPGYQAINLGGKINLHEVDTELAVAWKNNNFVFDRLEIKQVMRMIARWYNVEIVYQGEIPSATFWGSVSRFDNISDALIPLEATENVHFKIEGRKIYVFR